jgi:hypothetical protein
MPDEDAESLERFLQSVQHWLLRKVPLADVEAELLRPETLPPFRSEVNAMVSAATDFPRNVGVLLATVGLESIGWAIRICVGEGRKGDACNRDDRFVAAASTT